MQWDSKMSIRNDDELERALKRVDEVFHAEEESPEAAERDKLVELIERYEDQHYRISVPPYGEETDENCEL